jgi:hypothetical protein
VKQVERAALAHHGVEIEGALETLPQLQREFVEAHVGGLEVVGADDGGVAGDVAEAEWAALEDGDVILAIDGRQPTSGSHATRILASYQPGEKVTLRIVRLHKTVDLEATLPERIGHRHVESGEGLMQHVAPPLPPGVPPPPAPLPPAAGAAKVLLLRDPA